MKIFAIVCFFTTASICLARPETYDTKYDNIDLEEIVSNKRLLESYMKCVLDEGKCTPEGAELKSHIREALENHCEFCSEAQLSGTKFMIKRLINHEPEYWKQLNDKYDPNGKYTAIYEEELRNL